MDQIDRNCFPNNGCLVCVRNFSTDGPWRDSDLEQTFMVDHSMDLQLGSMICIQLPNGFQFSLYGKALLDIDTNCYNVIKSNSNDIKICSINNYLIDLINQMFDICQNMKPRTNSDDKIPKIPHDFEKKFEFDQETNHYHFGLFNQHWTQINKASIETYDILRMINLYNPRKIGHKQKHFEHFNMIKSAAFLAKKDFRSRCTLDEWIQMLTNYKNHSDTSDWHVEVANEWIDIVTQSNKNFIAVHRCGNTVGRYEWKIVSKIKGIYETYAAHTGGLYYHIPGTVVDESDQGKENSVLCWGKYESDMVSEIIIGSVKCFDGMKYLCDLIGTYCGGDSYVTDNVQTLMQLYKKQVENLKTDAEYIEDLAKYKQGRQEFQLSRW